MMKRTGLLFAIVVLLHAPTAVGQGSTFKPKNGFIPDERTALRVAEAVLSAIYGEKQVESERPFSVKLARDVWIIKGAELPVEMCGGIAEIRISKRTGEILHVSHGR